MDRDRDGDGNSDKLEMRLGLDPDDPMSVFRITQVGLGNADHLLGVLSERVPVDKDQVQYTFQSRTHADMFAIAHSQYSGAHAVPILGSDVIGHAGLKIVRHQCPNALQTWKILQVRRQVNQQRRRHTVRSQHLPLMI